MTHKRRWSTLHPQSPTFPLQLCRPPILVLKIEIKKYTCMQIGGSWICHLVGFPNLANAMETCLTNIVIPKAKTSLNEPKTCHVILLLSPNCFYYDFLKP